MEGNALPIGAKKVGKKVRPSSGSEKEKDKARCSRESGRESLSPYLVAEKGGEKIRS